MRIINLQNNKESSFKGFKRDSSKKINAEYLLFTEVVKRKILSRTELDKYIKSGDLIEVKFKNKRYIQRTNLAEFLKKRI